MIFGQTILGCIDRAEKIGATSPEEAFDLVRMLLLEEMAEDERRSARLRGDRLARYEQECETIRRKRGWVDTSDTEDDEE